MRFRASSIDVKSRIWYQISRAEDIEKHSLKSNNASSVLLRQWA